KSRVGPRTIPAHRRTDRLSGRLTSSESRSERPPCCASIYRRSRDNGECAIAATAVRSKGVEMAIMTIAVFRRVELGSVDEPSRSARKDDRARDSAFDLPLGTTVVARVFVHFERAVATYRVSGVREPEDVREGDRHRREFLDPDRCPRRGRYT
ncbi:conserved hypothetical protein, partial [Trichinella spiralis]|uniref:hypothetical protein n=1 Tax=Trichinella spiralis TaxID=6334 RepID=UPI0001EFD281